FTHPALELMDKSIEVLPVFTIPNVLDLYTRLRLETADQDIIVRKCRFLCFFYTLRLFLYAIFTAIRFRILLCRGGRDDEATGDRAQRRSFCLRPRVFGRAYLDVSLVRGCMGL